jgi:hypothetical protein
MGTTLPRSASVSGELHQLSTSTRSAKWRSRTARFLEALVGSPLSSHPPAPRRGRASSLNDNGWPQSVTAGVGRPPARTVVHDGAVLPARPSHAECFLVRYKDTCIRPSLPLYKANVCSLTLNKVALVLMPHYHSTPRSRGHRPRMGSSAVGLAGLPPYGAAAAAATVVVLQGRASPLANSPPKTWTEPPPGPSKEQAERRSGRGALHSVFLGDAPVGRSRRRGPLGVISFDSAAGRNFRLVVRWAPARTRPKCSRLCERCAQHRRTPHRRAQDWLRNAGTWLRNVGSPAANCTSAAPRFLLSLPHR